MLSLFYLCFWAGIARAFNLDTENVVKWDGEPGSLFGFSLAMHQQLNPNKRLCKALHAESESKIGSASNPGDSEQNPLCLACSWASYKKPNLPKKPDCCPLEGLFQNQPPPSLHQYVLRIWHQERGI